MNCARKVHINVVAHLEKRMVTGSFDPELSHYDPDPGSWITTDLSCIVGSEAHYSHCRILEYRFELILILDP